MILDSFDYAETDFEARQLIEVRLEADNILDKVQKAESSPAWRLLTADEIAAIAAAVTELTTTKAGNDLAQIRASITGLDHATRNLAEKMMEAAVSGAMRGKTMQTASDELDRSGDPEIHAPHPFAKAEFDDSTKINPTSEQQAEPGQNPEEDQK